MLKNRIIIVTGGSGLIGRAILKQIVDWNGLPINFDINPCDVPGAINIKCNVSDNLGFDKSIEKVISKYNRIHGLINCAYPRTADWGHHSVEDIPIKSWKENIDLHLNSYFYSCQQVLRLMKKNQDGSIVNIGSIYGSLGNDFSLYDGLDMNPPPAYSAIKGGIINLTRYLASYYGKYNITINCVSPGGIYNNQNQIFVNRYIDQVPSRRMGKPEDIAPITAFLLTKGANYINGENIIVDGGWSII